MRNMTTSQRIFNYRLSRARRIIENAFGICAARFRVLLKPMELKPQKCNKVVLAICALHNFLITRKSLYSEKSDFDVEEEDGRMIRGNWRTQITGTEMLPLMPHAHLGRVSNDAQSVRSRFMNYFVNEGEVAWQYTAVGAGNF